MSYHFSRRDFMKSSLAAASLAAVNVSVPAFSSDKAPSSKLNIAIIGPNGRGMATVTEMTGENIVAMCDADTKRLDGAMKHAPQAQKFTDFRKLYETVKDLDAVCVCTPDHTHAPASLMGMRMGLHCYCEKPLTHDIRESRVMREVAAEKKLVTQMGTQIHAGENYRRAVEIVRSGALGDIYEAHVWCGKGWGMPEDAKRPTETPPVPETLNWDAWIGPAKMRPYHSCYHPGGWRRWWDFGNGTLGDMGCHYMDLVFWALNLRDCLTVEATGPAVNPECAPLALSVKYEFPARDKMPPCLVTWHDGTLRPPVLAEKNLKLPGAGVLFVGKDGMLFADYTKTQLLPESKFADFKRPEPWIPSSPGHHKEWLQGIRENKPGLALCHFDYSAPLTETILLGSVAYRVGEKLEWDAKNLRTNNDTANALITPEYREGWTL
ncbi:MAG: Gfo/Idh/MocA family oxidoreductase [Planctomycetia bacterium]|nr:Gfo/Idh/MocA family oxidoreductase [Planctomycetia bacterium]